DERVEILAVITGADATDRNPAATLDRHRARRERFAKFILYPRGPLLRRRDGDRRVQVIIHQRAAVDLSGAGGHLRMLLRHRGFIRGCGVGEHAAVAIECRIAWRARTSAAGREIADGAVVARRLRKLLVERARPLHRRLAPHELLHRLLGLDPWPAGFAPAG